MPFYTFRLESFRIGNTRALHEDTDTVTALLQVGEQSYGTLIKDMGDVNNGDHQVGLEFPPVQIEDPNTQVVFNYIIANAGDFHGDLHSKLSAAAETLAGTLAGAGVGLKDVGVWLIVAGGTIVILDFLFNVLDPNCDGPVAADQIIVPASDFDKMVPGGTGTFTQTRQYPGQKSQDGCGGNSFYTVTYSVTIEQPAPPPPPDPCQQIEDDINGLESDIQDSQEELKNASSKQKVGIIAEIRRLQQQLAEKQKELDNCRS